MARLSRLAIAHHPHYVLLRAREGAAAFCTADDYRDFLTSLRETAAAHQVAIHAYVLLPDQAELLATPATPEGISKAMQALGRRYVRSFNRRHTRTGALWDGRFRSAVIEADPYLLLCSRVIEAAPVRTGRVSEAAAYPWSSARHHHGLAVDPVVTDHPLVWALGNTPYERQSAYRELAGQPVSERLMAMLTTNTLRGRPTGSDQFIAGLEKESKRMLIARRRGRPKRA